MFDEAFIDQKIACLADAVIKRLPPARIAQRYFSFEQAGEYIGVSEESIRYYVNQGWLPVCSKSAKRWIDKEDIDRFMGSHKRFIKVPGK